MLSAITPESLSAMVRNAHSTLLSTAMSVELTYLR
jgi:hypothetical protein